MALGCQCCWRQGFAEIGRTKSAALRCIVGVVTLVLWEFIMNESIVDRSAAASSYWFRLLNVNTTQLGVTNRKIL